MSSECKGVKSKSLIANVDRKEMKVLEKKLSFGQKVKDARKRERRKLPKTSTSNQTKNSNLSLAKRCTCPEGSEEQHTQSTGITYMRKRS